MEILNLISNLQLPILKALNEHKATVQNSIGNWQTAEEITPSFYLLFDQSLQSDTFLTNAAKLVIS